MGFTAAQLSDGETIFTSAGTLTLNAPAANGTGTWTFTPAPVSATTDVNISITLIDADGDSDTDTHTIEVVNVNAPLTISGAVAGLVEEEHSLPGGIEDTTDQNGFDTDESSPQVTNATGGNFATLVTGGIDGTLSFAFAPLAGNPAVSTVANGALTSGGHPVYFDMEDSNLIGYANANGDASDYNAGTDTKVFTITLDPATGAYTFTLNAPVDHPIHAPSTEDAIAINLNGMVTVTDSGGPAGDTNVPLNASITVIDDVPVAHGDTAVAVAGAGPSYDLMLVLDLSLSMNAVVSGSQTRLDIAQAALNNLIDAYDGVSNDISIRLVTFNSTGTLNPITYSTSGGAGQNLADLKALINSFTEGSSLVAETDYQDAVNSALPGVNAWAPATGNHHNIVYFVSDGQPQDGDVDGNDTVTIDDALETSWETALAAKNAIAHAVGIDLGGSPDTQHLQDVAYPEANVFLTDSSNLSSILVGTVGSAPSVTDNVIDNLSGSVGDDFFGDDGGRILSIEVGLVTYTYDPAGNDITASTGPNPAQNTPVLNVATPAGGTLTFYFAPTGGHAAGEWAYVGPTSGTPTETFAYTIVDGDGDTASANLTINVVAPPDTTVPTVTINQAAGQPDPDGTAPVLFDVVFSEAVTGFTAADISLAGSTAPGTLVVTVTGSGANYQVSVTGMTGSGTIVASVVANAATDGANTSTASTSVDNTVTVDMTPPTVTINQTVGQPDPDGTAPVLFTVVFSEAVTGFTSGDVTISGTAPGPKTVTVTGSGTTYQVSVTGMTGSGTVVASIAAGAATDAYGNASVASTSTDNTVTYTVDTPAVANNDTVIHNFGGDGFDVPEWAFLFNDTDAEGNAFDITGVSNSSGLSDLDHNGGTGTNGTVTIDDNFGGGAGGSFVYTVTGNDTANVTVQSQDGGNLTGTANGDILVGDGDSDTFTGNGGNDVILAGGGNDTLNGGGGNDILVGGAGADTMNGGADADTFVIGSGASLGTISGSSISGFDIINGFNANEDKIDLLVAPTIAADATVNGSNVIVGAVTISSHQIDDGMVQFDASGSFDTPISITTNTGVAAAVAYLRANDLGAAGTTVAFTATIGGTSHVFIYQQIGASPDAATDIFVDLVNPDQLDNTASAF